MQTPLTDEEMIKAIKTGGRELEKAMAYIYRHYREAVLVFITRRKGSLEDAKDIFQDGVCHLLMNIRKERFEGKSSLSTYLTAICKNLWYTQFAKRAGRAEKIQLQEPNEESMPSPDELILKKERSQLVQSLLDQLGEKCRLILGLWTLSYSTKEITRAVGYGSEGVTRKKKSQCFKRLVGMAKDRPDLFKELKEHL